MQCVDLTDDELLRAIAVNTDAVSDLLHHRAELDAKISSTTDPIRRSELLSSYMGAASKFETEYRTYTAELRRRYPA